MIIGINGKIGSGKDTVGNIIQYLTDKNVTNQTFEFWYTSNFYTVYKATGMFQIKKFAGKLKQIASILTGIEIEKFEDQEFKKLEMDEKWWYKNIYDAGWDREWTRETVDYPAYTSPEETIQKPTYRQFLQHLGTDALRKNLHPNIWVNALFSDYIITKDKNQWFLEKTGLNRIEFKTKDYNQYCILNQEFFETNLPNWIITDMRFPNEMEAVKQRNGITIRIKRIPTAIINEVKYFIGTDGLPEHPSETALDNVEFDYEIQNDGTIEELIEKVKEILIKEKIL